MVHMSSSQGLNVIFLPCYICSPHTQTHTHTHTHTHTEKTETVLSSTHSSGRQKALYLMQLCIHFFSFCSEQRTSSLWCVVVCCLFESSDYHRSSLLLKMSPSLSQYCRRNKTFTFTFLALNSFIFSYFLGWLKLQKDGGKLRVIKELSQWSVKIFTQAASCPNWQLEDIWLSFIMHYPCHLATQRERGLAVSMSINAVRVSVWAFNRPI